MTASAMPPQVAARIAAAQAQAVAHATVRATGVLTADAKLQYTTSGSAFLQLDMRPARGLRYTARIDLGADATTHMLAQAELAHLRAGVLVSVAGDGLEPRQDHGHAVLCIVGARDAISFHGAIDAATTSPTAQEGPHHVD
jgi:hypothetical protein